MKIFNIPATPGINLVQVRTTAGAATSLAYASGNTLGNLLICCWYMAGSSPPTISDSQSNAWVVAQASTSWGNSSISGGVSYCLSSKAGANTVSSTGSAPFVIAEFSGLGAIDQNSILDTVYDHTHAAWATTAVTTRYKSELLVGVVTTQWGGVTVTSPFLALGGLAAICNASGFYQIVSAIQTGVSAGGAMAANDNNGINAVMTSFYFNNPNSIVGG